MNEEGKFRTRDGLDFYERRWAPEGPAQAELVLVHGFGEHCNRYGGFAKELNGAGIAVHTYDQRGFGQSPGARASIHDFDVWLADLDDYLAFLRPRLAGRPWFLMGHSFGGMVITRYAETRTIDARGIVFSSPFLAFSDDTPKLLLSLAKILGTVTPWLPVGNVDNQWLSRIPEAITEADNDPLCFHGRVRARTGLQFARTMEKAAQEFGAIAQPSLVVCGSEDHVVSPKGAKALYAGMAAQDKTLRVFEGGYHELWNDLDKDAFTATVSEWILKRISNRVQ